MKKVAVINDLSGFGKCSLTAAIPVISAQGVQVCPLATAVLSNQTGYPEYFCRDLTDDIPEIISHWQKLGAKFDAILTGFFSDARQVDHINTFCDIFKNENNLLIVDPVMADNGMIYPAYSYKLCDAVIKLASRADIITPNLTEFAVLTGCGFSEFTSKAYSADILDLIHEKALGLMARTCISCVLVTSIPAHEGRISNCIITKSEIHTVSAQAFGGSFSGTGDLFAAAVCGGILKGKSVTQAVEATTVFIEASVRDTVMKGTRPEEGVCFEPHLDLL